jgi:hypothetical protein
MATNGTEVLIVDGTAGWLVTGTVLTQIVDVDFPNGVTIAACLDSYFVVWGNGTQKFYWSETPGSGVAWDGLDFASVEGSPDELVGGVADHRQLWFVGTNSTEVYDNTGNADQLFQRSGNTFIEQGTVSPWTVQSSTTRLFGSVGTRTGKRSSSSRKGAVLFASPPMRLKRL